jgi:hypothetical protein
MPDESRKDSATPRFHIAILEDDGNDAGARRTRLMLTPEGSAQEALGDLLKYASPSADPAIVGQHIAAILHGSVGVHLLGIWPPSVTTGDQPTASDAYCSTCGQKVR